MEALVAILFFAAEFAYGLMEPLLSIVLWLASRNKR